MIHKVIEDCSNARAVPVVSRISVAAMVEPGELRRLASRLENGCSGRYRIVERLVRYGVLSELLRAVADELDLDNRRVEKWNNRIDTKTNNT